MQQFWQDLAGDFPSALQILKMAVRLLVAAVGGALPGLEREHRKVSAGLRTHILASLGCALFVLSAAEPGVNAGDMTRVIQGIATGIGFVGGGAILKSRDKLEVHGLTTATSIGLTAALGTAAGMGRICLPM